MYLDICLLMMLILLFFSFLMMYLGVYFLVYSLKIFIEFNIFNLNSSCIIMTIFLDWMSLFFLSVVLFISSSVVYYSKNYMMGDLMINRFISLVLMFVLSMMLLIISPNLISILLGWDGLGLVSYCLVIYYQNLKSFNAGMLTVLSNRVGDVFLLMSIAWMLNFGSWNYIFYLEFMKMNKEMMIILIFILLASFTKSAQIPFSSWLPAAMAAPTPVSSLVHSSTLVTAGVYLLIRFENLFNEDMIFWFLLFSLMTMFMSGLNANFEYDLKKIIALSTLSQLGLMMSILFLGFSEFAFFHLLTHALFKALLFMCAGAMIHNLMDFQDIRYMGSISIQMPMVSICFNFSNLALCGFPFLAGFYSKDMILEKFFLMDFNFFMFFMFFISTLFTVMYTFRLIFFSMVMNYNMSSLNFMSDKLWELNKSLLGLLLLVIIGGCYLSWMIFPYPYLICLPFYLKILPLLIIFLGCILGYLMYSMSLNMLNFKDMYFIKTFMGGMWFLPIISTYGLIKQPMIISMNLTYFIDQSWTENLMGQGMMKILLKYSSFLDLLIYYFNFMLNLFLMFLLIWWYYLIFF
uniref:NADH-ubiquinone oxidoreductase chain 5 n=1 Tax=Analcellicampa danfengensis TaxID=2419779 RepID=A0A7U0FNV5_9HYME|nr:NADH dehydrogenase subunit 5 [Analcellicampa danfengensis]QQV69254.1 NADH dehydrogenase subunit 5 [Analcellicampa danfengensis]